MKAFLSIFLAVVVAVSIGSVQAGPVHRAANVAKSTAETAKNVGHSVVKAQEEPCTPSSIRSLDRSRQFLRFVEIPSVLVRLDHIASFIVNVNHDSMDSINER